jgi:hypothetical protein
MQRHRAMAIMGAFLAALVCAVPSGVAATETGERGALGHTQVATTEQRTAVPFTGLDLALILGGGSGLLAAGAGLRRAAAKRA